MRRSNTYLAAGAAGGLYLGIAAALGLLLWVGPSGGWQSSEAWEGAFMLAALAAYPTTAVLDALHLHWGSYASQWAVFIAVAPPLNGLLVGAACGGIMDLLARLGRARSRRPA